MFPDRSAGVPLGINGAYKKQIQNSSAGRARRYGFRLIYRWHAIRAEDGSIDRWRLTKLHLYDKTDQANIADEAVAAAIDKGPLPVP